MKIRITEKAEEQLKEIYKYYKREASITIAREESKMISLKESKL